MVSIFSLLDTTLVFENLLIIFLGGEGEIMSIDNLKNVNSGVNIKGEGGR